MIIRGTKVIALGCRGHMQGSNRFDIVKSKLSHTKGKLF